MKSQWTNELTPGAEVNDSFVIRRLELKEYSGGRYLSLEIGDKSGRIPAVCWENVRELAARFRPGSIVQIQGTVGTFRDVPQVTVQSMMPVSSKYYDPLDYLPAGPVDPRKQMARIDAIVSGIADVHYRMLLTEIFSDGMIRPKFTYAPAAKLWHHSYVGGLAEHTLKVAAICQAACSIYTQLRGDLLIAGALLHDIGKIDTYSLENYFDYTDEGRLIGHIVIADRIITGKLARLSDFPPEKKKLVRHLVLSHQGTLEQGSPVVPQTLEANVLYLADLLDSRVGGILKAMNKKNPDDKRWSPYVKLIDRYIYLGENAEEENNE